MSVESKLMLVGFESADAIAFLLKRVGIQPDFGPFLHEHLFAVLRKQFSDLIIESIEFLTAQNCTANGVAGSAFNILDIDSLTLPFDVAAVVMAQNERYELKLAITIRAKRTDGSYKIDSDVRVNEQRFLGKQNKGDAGMRTVTDDK